MNFDHPVYSRPGKLADHLETSDGLFAHRGAIPLDCSFNELLSCDVTAQFFSLYFHKKLIMEKMNDLRDLLKHEIEDLQSVEDQIIEALPKMIEKANNPDLKKALSEHLNVTKQHKTRLEKVMQNLGAGDQGSNGRKKGILGGIFGGGKQECKGMKGIIEEGGKIMSADISPEALDAAIIASAQKVEHYEICGYGTARTFARELGLEQVTKQLEQTLNEEYEADDLLTSLAIMGVNERAERSGATSASASSRGRSAGRVSETANREMEMEPVVASRGRSEKRSERSASKTTASKAQTPKASGTPRAESGRNSSSSKKAVSNDRSSKTSGRGGGTSSAGGRSGAAKKSSRGGR
jgi:ferritin-like metal-binding protein YciE